VAKLLIGPKNVRGCENPCQIWWGSWVARRLMTKKCDVFCLFVCLSRFGITKVVITETLCSSVTFKTIMASLHAGRFVAGHLYSSFSVDPQNFPLGANLYKKLPFFCDFWCYKPTFLKPQRWNLARGCRPGTPSPKQNFVKIA